MASREEEKRLRREEREKAEAAAAASASRSKRLQFLLGALLTIAVVVGAVLLITGGSDDKNGGSEPTASVDGAEIPPPEERDLDKAAEAANCVVEHPPLGSADHVEEPVEYVTNPPTSGNHSATPALDGIYTPDTSPEPENWVHSLEHGRIVFQYAPGSDETLIGQMETLASEPLNGKDAYKALLIQNNTDMPFAVAASAWGHFIGCKEPSDAMFDALRNFRVRYVDKGPEPGIPPTN